MKDEATIIANFAILWNLYESHYFENRGNVTYKKEDMYDLVRKKEYYLIDADTLLVRFTERYNEAKQDGVTNFEKLKLSASNDTDLDTSAKMFVRTTLDNDKANAEEKTIAALLIIHRLRNNLFHGEKDLTNIAKEVEPLVIANECLFGFIQRNDFIFQ